MRAQLTVVGDGPVGAVGRALDQNENSTKCRREWALGMKFVIELPEDTTLQAGAVWHTFGFPEPEIFGFLYVHPDRLASVGIFVPSWMGDPARTAYRYLQHYIQHPLLWRHLKNGTLRSWGAKSLEESGKHGEPSLTGDGFARIGEGSGSTNMLTGSGVDEAWTTGVHNGAEIPPPFGGKYRQAMIYVDSLQAAFPPVERDGRSPRGEPRQPDSAPPGDVKMGSGPTNTTSIPTAW